MFLVEVSLMKDAVPLLTEDGNKTATTCFGKSGISLFGWDYMKLKFMIMLQSQVFLL